MKANRGKQIQLLITLMALVSIIFTGASYAGEGAYEAEDGYVVDSNGNVVRSGFGECIRHSGWSKEKAVVVGCDGYTLTHKITVMRGEGGKDKIREVLMPQAELFAFDSDEMSDAGKAYLSSRSGEIGQDFDAIYSVTIIGHTDSTGDADYNLDLSNRRALAVSEHLIAIGVPPNKLRILGRGENHPMFPNDTRESRAQNRRVEVLVVGEPRNLDRMIIPSVALFERRESELTEDGISLLKNNLDEARELFREAKYVEVVGHTDNVGGADYNLDLSEKRAMAVVRYLEEIGVDPSKLLMRGAGQSRPVASNATEEGRAENRRVELLVFGRKKEI